MTDLPPIPHPLTLLDAQDATAPGRPAGEHTPGAAPDVPTRRSAVRRPRWRGYTAFVLSGGGARGAFQVGALKALLEHGERPDVVVGTSIGSWNGAWLAQHPTAESLAGLDDVWRSLTSLRVLLGIEQPRTALPPARAGMRFLMAARRVARGYPSLYSDTGLRQIIARHVGDATFESLSLPLRIIATDLTRGTRAVLSSGPLAPAILASSAMPGVFPPVCIDNHVYLDGGALDNCSLDTALQLGARRIFVVDVDSGTFDDPSPVWSNELTPAALRRHVGSMPAVAAVFERVTQVVCQYQFEQALRRLPRGVEVHVLRPGRGVCGSVLDFERAGEWIDHAHAVTHDELRARLPASRPVATAS
jgi:NTE family protein